MPQTVLEMAKELVMAQITAYGLTPESMRHALQNTHASLIALKMQEEGEGRGVEAVGERTDWKQSIGRYAVTCLECGATFKQLSTRHLRNHGLDARSYRAKYRIPRTQALAARETTAQRRRIVQRIRPWEKAPRKRAGRQRRQ
jgi:predicted transcriptional regulator